MSPISVLFLCARSLCWMNPKEFSLHCIKLRHVDIELCFLLMWSMSRNISVLAIIGLIVTFHALQSTLICLSCHFTCLRLPFSSTLLKQRAISISAFIFNMWTLCWWSTVEMEKLLHLDAFLLPSLLGCWAACSKENCQKCSFEIPAS